MKKIHWFTDKTISSTHKAGETFEITSKDLVTQIFKVLKLQKGEHIVLKNTSCAYDCEILSVSPREVNVLILNIKEKTSKKNLSLLVCIPKKDKFELLLEKCTEIGVTDFYPIISDRTIKTNINIERALKIIEEASEQAQRLDTPTLHPITKLDDILDELKPIVFDVDGEPLTGRSGLAPTEILIGPEGGFSQRELLLFKEKGLSTYKLGETVLKTETAAIVVSGILLQNQ